MQNLCGNLKELVFQTIGLIVSEASGTNTKSNKEVIRSHMLFPCIYSVYCVPCVNWNTAKLSKFVSFGNLKGIPAFSILVDNS